MFSPAEIERFNNTPTPFYYYKLDLLEDTLVACNKASSRFNYHVHYAFKANTNNEILDLVHQNGFGADCVSGNEVKKAIDRGFSSDQIVFAGVGKSDQEINDALDANIFCFNVESIPEMEVINDLATAKQKVAQIALRINPNVNAKTHHYITTGLEENKFGINMWELEDVLVALKKLPQLKLIGLHFHIGSQITDLNDFKGLCLRVNEIQLWFYERQIIVDHINVGGGLGIDYENPNQNNIPNFDAFFPIVQ